MRRGLTKFDWDEDPEDMVRTEPVYTYGDDDYESDAKVHATGITRTRFERSHRRDLRQSSASLM